MTNCLRPQLTEFPSPFVIFHEKDGIYYFANMISLIGDAIKVVYTIANLYAHGVSPKILFQKLC